MRSNADDTIAAISTTIGDGGIGIVRLSGPDSLKIADAIFVSKDGGRPSEYSTYTVHYGHIVKKMTGSARVDEGEIVDEVILTVMKAPKSYTKEDIIEINCHGGIQALKKVLELVIKNGARSAEPGEFTKRAFLNGRIDLAQAEAVLDTIRAKTESSFRAAVRQLEGGLSGRVDAIRDKVVGLASEIEASIDFPEEELEISTGSTMKKLEEALNDLSLLIDTSKDGIVLREGVLAVITGKPNVGKSSLMNLLLKRDRVIVTPIPGTTRDAVEEMISLKGLPIRLVDTAGISQTKDTIEKEGMRRSKDYLESADVVFLMLDGSTGMDGEDAQIIDMIKDKKRLVIINKTDLAKKVRPGELKKFFKDDPVIEISVKERKNIELLESSIADMIWSGSVEPGEGTIVTNTRHKELLERSLSSILAAKKSLEDGSSGELVAIDLKEAVYSLGMITGKSVSDDILDRIFEEFCIGK